MVLIRGKPKIFYGQSYINWHTGALPNAQAVFELRTAMAEIGGKPKAASGNRIVD
jgi:hypothetical protein